MLSAKLSAMLSSLHKYLDLIFTTQPHDACAIIISAL